MNCNELVDKISGVIEGLAYLNSQEDTNVCLGDYILTLWDVRMDIRGIQDDLMDIHGSISEKY